VEFQRLTPFFIDDFKLLEKYKYDARIVIPEKFKAEKNI
jgi:hypothetical protein